MATPNYSFEKRKRELAKKAAKQAKLLRKDTKVSASEVPAEAEAVQLPSITGTESIL